MTGAIFSILGASPAAAWGQSAAVGDSLLNRGALDRAESVYYAAVRVRPHDPAARFALGRYLAERGAPRVAATLMEEAIQFGGEPSVIAPDLAPLYLEIGDYRALSELPASPLTAGELARARWLLLHPTRVIAPESTLMAVYHQSIDPSGSLGRIPIRVNGHTLDAVVSTRVRGLVVTDTSVARRLHRFAGGAATPEAAPVERSRTPAVADSIGIGRLLLANYPVIVDASEASRSAAPAIIGIDVLSQFAPTLDPHAGRITLRANGSVSSPRRGSVIFPTLLTHDDYTILQAGGWAPVTTPQIARLLDRHPWIIDGKRGEIIVEP